MGMAFDLVGETIRYRATGDVDHAGGLATLREGFAAAAAAVPGRRWHLLFDVRHSSENRSADELRAVAAEVAGAGDLLTGRCAVVAADPLHYGLGRMFAVFAEGLGLAADVFPDVPAAEAWLGGG